MDSLLYDLVYNFFFLRGGSLSIRLIMVLLEYTYQQYEFLQDALFCYYDMLILVDVLRNTYYYASMIKSFKCKDTEKLFNDTDVKRFRSILRIARIKLEILNASISLNSLNIPPGNRREALRGDRKGQHSIRINSQWRICFTWQNENAYHVEIVDYHKG